MWSTGCNSCYHDDRGIPATPIALMLDRDNGFCPAEDPIWRTFPKEPPDYFLDELANLGFVVLRFDHAWRTDLRSVEDRPASYFSLGADF